MLLGGGRICVLYPRQAYGFNLKLFSTYSQLSSIPGLFQNPPEDSSDDDSRPLSASDFADILGPTPTPASTPTIEATPRKFTRKFTKQSQHETSQQQIDPTSEVITPSAEVAQPTSKNSRSVDGVMWQQRKLEWARRNERHHQDTMNRLRSKVNAEQPAIINRNPFEIAQEYRIKQEKLKQEKLQAEQKDIEQNKLRSEFDDLVKSNEKESEKTGFFSRFFS